MKKLVNCWQQGSRPDPFKIRAQAEFIDFMVDFRREKERGGERVVRGEQANVKVALKSCRWLWGQPLTGRSAKALKLFSQHC